MTGQASKVSRGLRTVGINISALAQDAGELKTGYDDVVISLNNADGSMKSTFEVMSELKGTWDKMSVAQQTSLAQNLAGKTQFDVFTATMKNFKTATDAVVVAQKSSGSAMGENTIYMESLEAKIASLKSAFENLSRNTIESEFVKSLISGVTGLVKFLDATNAVEAAVLGVAILLGGKFAAKIVGAIGKLAALQGSEITLAAINGALGTSFTLLNIAMGGIAIVAAVAVMAISGVQSSNEKLMTSAIESSDAIKTEISALQSSKEAVEKAADREALIKALDDSGIAYENELKGIEDVNAAREVGLGLIDQEAQKKASQWLNENITAYNEATRALEAYSQETLLTEDPFQEFDPDTGIIPALTVVGTLSEKYSQLNDWLSKARSKSLEWQQTHSLAISAVAEASRKYGEQLDTNNAVVEEHNYHQAILTAGLEAQKQAADPLAAAMASLDTAVATQTEKYKEMTSQLDLAETARQKYGDGIVDDITDLTAYQDAGLDLIGVLVQTSDGWKINEEKLNEFSGKKDLVNQALLDISRGLYDTAAVQEIFGDTAATVAEEVEAASNETKDNAAINTPQFESFIERQKIALLHFTTTAGETSTNVSSDISSITETANAQSKLFGVAMVGFGAGVIAQKTPIAEAVSSIADSLGDLVLSAWEKVGEWNRAIQSMLSAPANPPQSSSQPGVGGSKGVTKETGTDCFANGTTSADIGKNAVVDEHNRTEIIARNLGGRSIRLERADGVLPNPVTQNLMAIGKFPVESIASIMNANKISSDSGVPATPINQYDISGVTVYANNAMEFATSLKTLALQRSTKRT